MHQRTTQTTTTHQKRRIIHIGLFCLFMSCCAWSQQKYTISGNIEDASNGEELIGATVLIKELGNGGTSNVYGFYSVTIPEGEYTMVVSYIGYELDSRTIQLDESMAINIELQPSSSLLEEVVISSEDENIRSTQMSVNKLQMSEIDAVPVLFGEKDVIKTIQLLPGIKSSEGGGGFFVRGG